MTTWHQDRAATRDRAPLWHKTKWTIVSNPPGQCMTVTRCNTREEALQAQGPGEYILPPGGSLSTPEAQATLTRQEATSS
jgi:hypothetical protein